MKYFIANLYFYTRKELLAIADGKDELIDFLDRIKGSELESETYKCRTCIFECLSICCVKYFGDDEH